MKHTKNNSKMEMSKCRFCDDVAKKIYESDKGEFFGTCNKHKDKAKNSLLLKSEEL